MGAGGVFNSDFLRPDQENILAVARFKNPAGYKTTVSKVVHVTKGTFPFLSQRRQQIGQLLPGARTPSRSQSLFCSTNQCLSLSLYVSTAKRKIYMMKTLVHFFLILRIELRSLHIDKYSNSELYSQTFVCFWLKVNLLYCSSWPWTFDPPSSVSTPHTLGLQD